MVTIRFSDEEMYISISEVARYGRRIALSEDETGWFTWSFPPEQSGGLPEILDEMKLESFAKEYQAACEIITWQVRKLAIVQRQADIPSIFFKSDVTKACELWEKIISNAVRVTAFKF